jgi:N-methylhydantoinase B/oxoprolinase/acetone carboxylase alpha subunit
MSHINKMQLNLINNYLVNTCREMGLAMMRTSYSPIFNEGLDFSCVIFNHRGEMTAQADFVPSMAGAIMYVVKWTIEELGPDYFQPGDVILHNDPYRGGCHLPEHAVIKPVFDDGELYGFVANIAHITEIGGKAIGGFSADATDIYQEGLRIPPVRIMQGGDYVQDVWKLILTNHRTPHTTWGDFHAMIGSLTVAERRLLQLIDKFGSVFVHQAEDELMAYAEQYMRAEIREIPNGEYGYEDYIDDDGIIVDRHYRIKATVVARDHEILVDYTGSSPQAAGPINCTFGVTASATYNAILQITDSSIPRNAGCYAPIKIINPPGTVLNVQYPAPEVGGNSEIHGRIVDVLLAALSEAVPDRVAASSGGSSHNFLFGGIHPDTKRYYAGYHFEGVGWGAQHDHDGNNMVIELGGNCRNTPIEVFETKYPWLVREYLLNSDSGGPGKYRGGLGSRRVLEVVAPEITISALIDRIESQPYGLMGGRSGSAGGIWIRRKGDTEFRRFSEIYGTASPGKFSGIKVHAGDQILLITPGGGGFGDPLERDHEAIREDMREGFVSPASAANSDSVTFDPNQRTGSGHKPD